MGLFAVPVDVALGLVSVTLFSSLGLTFTAREVGRLRVPDSELLRRRFTLATSFVFLVLESFFDCFGSVLDGDGDGELMGELCGEFLGDRLAPVDVDGLGFAVMLIECERIWGSAVQQGEAIYHSQLLHLKREK